MIKLNFAHLCDLAFLSQGGKANIIGIFKVIYANNLPVTHPKFSVIGSIITTDEIGQHTIKIEIVRKKDGQKVGPEMKLIIDVTKEQQEANFIVDVVNIKFEKDGEHLTKIFFDDSEIYSLPFIIKKP